GFFLGGGFFRLGGGLRGHGLDYFRCGLGGGAGLRLVVLDDFQLGLGGFRGWSRWFGFDWLRVGRFRGLGGLRGLLSGHTTSGTKTSGTKKSATNNPARVTRPTWAF